MDPHTEKIKQERAITRFTGLSRSQVRDALRTFAEQTKTTNFKGPPIPGPQNNAPEVKFSEQRLDRMPTQKEEAVAGVVAPEVSQGLLPVVVTGCLNGLFASGIAGYYTAPG